MKTFSTLLIILISLVMSSFSIIKKPNFYKKLQNYCETLSDEFDQIDAERKAALEEIGDYIFEKNKAGESVKMTVICTHNSRRSHMGQLWLEAAAAWYGVENVQGFSGGTEATAFNPRAVAAMKRAGFSIAKTYDNANPRYQAKLSRALEPIIMFSKRYDDAFNPNKNFAAVMVCSEADASCPIVPGAEERFAIPYEDPKHYDNTPSEQDKYDERCRQIAREFFYMMAYTKQKLVNEQENISN